MTTDQGDADDFYMADDAFISHVLSDIDFSTVTTWEELEFLLALHDITIDIDCAKVLAIAAAYDDGLADIICGTISQGSAFEKACSVEFIEFIMRYYYNVRTNKNVSKALLKGDRCQSYTIADMALTIKKSRMTADLAACRTDARSVVLRQYKLLDAIDARFPFLLVKFYVKNRKFLLMRDIEFLRWILQKSYGKCSMYPEFRKICSCLKADEDYLRNQQMFLN